MIIIAGSSNPKLAHKVAAQLKIRCIEAKAIKYPDCELAVSINECDLSNQQVLLIQSTSLPANDNIIELVLLAGILQRLGASKISAIIPYFGYSRQDKAQPYFSYSAELIANLLHKAGISTIFTFDLHSCHLLQHNSINIINIDPWQQYGLDHIDLLIDKNMLIIAPDQGSIKRATSFAELIDNKPLAITKQRLASGQVISKVMNGNIASQNCLIIDDIVATGDTLCSTAKLLYDHHAQSVSAFVSHGVFCKGCFAKLAKANFKQIYITDTIYHPALPNYFTTISVAQIIAAKIANLTNNQPKEKSE